MNEIEMLAARVGTGDAVARNEMRRALTGKLAHIVRRTVRTRSSDSSLCRLILAEADRVAHAHRMDVALDHKTLVATVCDRMCDLIMEQLDPDHAPSRAALETVCA